MLTVTYSPKSVNVHHAYNDEYSASDRFISYAKELAEYDESYELIVSTELAVEAIRCGIAEESIPWDRVTFMFNGNVIRHNEYGRFEEHPKGFLDASSILAYRTLNAQMIRRKKSINE